MIPRGPRTDPLVPNTQPVTPGVIRGIAFVRNQCQTEDLGRPESPKTLNPRRQTQRRFPLVNVIHERRAFFYVLKNIENRITCF